MKFNYFKSAKENGANHFYYALKQKQQYNNPRYMAAHWLAWAYTFQRMGNTRFSKDSLHAFLGEIKSICCK